MGSEMCIRDSSDELVPEDVAVQVALEFIVTSAEQLDPDVAKTVPAPEASITPDAEMVEDAAAVADASKTEPSNPKLKSPYGASP